MYNVNQNSLEHIFYGCHDNYNIYLGIGNQINR